MAQLKNLIVNGVARVVGKVFAPEFVGKLTGNADTATKATQDSAGQQINTTYIKGLSVSGTTITYTKGNGTTGTIATQDTNTDTKVTNTLATTTKAYLTGTTSSSTNTGTQVFDTGVYLSTTAGELVATKFTGTLNGNAATATKATQDSAGQQINTTYIKGLSVSGKTITYTKGDGTTGTITTQDTTYTHPTTSGNKHIPSGGASGQILRWSADGTAAWTGENNTQNTAGSTNTSSKIFLIGATSQSFAPVTYSHDTAYVDTDGCLYSNNTKVSVEGHTHNYAGSSSAGGAATKALQDGNGNVITDTYVNLGSDQTITAQKTFEGGVVFGHPDSYYCEFRNLGPVQQPACFSWYDTDGNEIARLNGYYYSGRSMYDGMGNVITNTYAPKYEYSTTDLTAGTSSLATGKLYIVYE